MDIQDVSEIEKATKFGRKDMVKFGMALFFIVGVMLYVSFQSGSIAGSTILVVAAMIGGYMAMNIGANDVANNVGPAVGSKALTLTGAIVIAAIFEASGAVIAGGEVVSTIKKGIINPAVIADTETFIWLMLAALMAGAIWLHAATAIGAPVSTTHSIVGGVLGAGIAAGGWGIANWETMGKIAASWVISPVLGGLIAAGFLIFIKRTITYQSDQTEAAKKIVPLLIGIMAWAFATYLIMKGLKHLWKTDFSIAALIGLAVAVGVYLLVRPMVARTAGRLANTKESVNRLFTIPLIFAAALLSFAHGANDVANAVGPLAAINDALIHGGIAKKAAIPLWVMLVGGLGIALGLALYGPKLIKTVGSEITDLDQMRAFCIAMAASITVIIATQLGLPVSSTHIAVGAVFGVGFLREYIKNKAARMEEEIRAMHAEHEREEVEAFLKKYRTASFREKERMYQSIKGRKVSMDHTIRLTKEEKKYVKNVYKHELVKRSHLKKIVAAWLITVPAAALLAGTLFYTIRGMMLP